MKIVILNECFFAKEHLDRLKKLGKVTEYKDTDTEQKAIERLQGVDIAIADQYFNILTKNVLESTNNLKLIAINSTGFDMVDIETANAKGIKISNASDFSTEAVAEHAIALMFAVSKRIPYSDKKVREKPFEIDPANPVHTEFIGFDVRGKTLGVIGLGNIGRRVAELGQAIGMKVIGYNRTPREVKGVTNVDLETLLKESDVVSINLALNADTKHIISEKELSLMKPTAILINTARAAHVDGTALYEAVRDEKIAGAGLDIFENTEDARILELDNVVFTPHSAWFTSESIKKLADIIIKNVEAFVEGKPQNIIK